MLLPDPVSPWLGLDSDALRFVEAHQARAVTIPGRAWRDLGDAVMLFSAEENEPFFNRLTAVRWPAEPSAFDARLRETCDLFAALERRPYIWLIPGLSEPADVVARLAANGFEDQGGGYDMVLTREPGDSAPLPPGFALEHWNSSAEDEIKDRAEVLATVIGASFDMPAVRHSNLVREISLTLTRPDYHAYVVKVDGQPVAAGGRYTFEGASYLSSIGTLPDWRRNGLATAVTNRLAADSLAEGVGLVYLGVYADNAAAIRLYRQLGFSMLGDRSADMLGPSSGQPQDRSSGQPRDRSQD